MFGTLTFIVVKFAAVNPPIGLPIDPSIVLLEIPIVDAPIDPIEPQVVQPPQPLVPPRASRGEAKLIHEVVLKLVSGVEREGHLVVMDNYFSSIGLFQDLFSRCIYKGFQEINSKDN
jgi:hypothetical protein